MRASIVVTMVAAVACFLVFPHLGRVAPAKSHTLRGTVFADISNQQVPLANVRIRCFGTNDSANDDVASPVTDAKGEFVVHVPGKYGTFVLVFAKNAYWAKQMLLSPTADPTGLGRIVLFPTNNALSAADRIDVEHIQHLLTGTDPELAQVLLASLQEQSQPGVRLATINGTGSMFPYPVYAQWAESYMTQTGVSLVYQSSRPGGAIKLVKDSRVIFGAADAPLKAEELKEAGLIQFPTIIGGVEPVVNIKGVRAGDLTLDGGTLASIYLGETVNWNDSRIQKLNPKLALPNLAIVPIYRSDGSATTALIAEYLSKANPRFKETVGVGTIVQWPTGMGAKGDEGVANATAQTPGAIGYIAHVYASKNDAAYVKLINADGGVVEPSLASFTSAATNTDWSGASTSLINRPGAKSWPITGASYILMYKKPADPAQAAQALRFFDWAYKNGTDMASTLDFATLPDNARKAAVKTWQYVVTDGGIPVLETPAP